jgi:dTDP-4-dehydrorhamnose reductase
MRVAVSGSTGRLGRALIAALEDAPFCGPFGPIPWHRGRLDLDDPGRVTSLLAGDRVEVVVHAAAWTDVEGCAREPDVALRRNGVATGVIAAACASRGIDLVVVSTNEVFDGCRTDGRGYLADDSPNPINAYGASKLAGERAAAEAYAWPTAGARAIGGRPPSPGSGRLGIVRTAWLFGPPGNDFPMKILAAADRAQSAGEPLRVVGDEIGSPTYAADLAEAIAALIGSGDSSGIHHVVNEGAASRADWAREIVRSVGLTVTLEEVPASSWQRASRPPAWAVLQPTALPDGEPLRPWREALADYVPWLVRSRTAGAPR